MEGVFIGKEMCVKASNAFTVRCSAAAGQSKKNVHRPAKEKVNKNLEHCEAVFS